MFSNPVPATVSPCPVFWLFGLSGAGKSTLANALARELRSRGRAVLALDGHQVRAGLSTGLGFSDADRAENLRRAAEVAELGSASGLCAVASFITPLESHRQLIAHVLHRQNLALILIDAPLAICRERDTKGLDAPGEKGKVDQMTGLSSPFDAPAAADLVVPTAEESIAASSERLLTFALARLSAPGN